MFFQAIYIYAIFLPCYSTLINSFLTYQYYVHLALELKHHYNSECLVVVNSNELSFEHQTVAINKILSRNETIAMHLPFHNTWTTFNKFQCGKNRPLYVLFANNVTRKYLHKLHMVPSYPRWVLILDTPSPTNYQFLEDIYVPFNCEFLVAENYGSRIELSEVYQVAERTPLNKLRLGSWSQDIGLKLAKESLYNRRFNLEGLVLKAITLRYIYPEAFLVTDNKQRLLKMDLYGKIWLLLEERYNFTTEILESPVVGGFGYLINGSWNGMMSSVVDKKADVAIGAFTYDQERMKAVDYLDTVSNTKIFLFVRLPTTMQLQWTSFLSPFSSTMWLTIICSILLFGFALSTTHRAGHRMIGFEGRRGADEFLLPGSLFHVFGLYCTQGPGIEPKSHFSRSVLLLAGFTAVVIASAYSGALTSFITVQKLDLPHETIEEYVDDPTFQLEMSVNGFWIYLNNSRADFDRKLYKRMVNKVNGLPTNKISGFKKLCNQSNYGWFGTYNPNAEFMKMLKCETISVPGYMRVDAESVIVTKRSPYKKLFNRNLHFLRWSGLLDRIVRKASLKHAKKVIEKNMMSANFQQVVPIISILFLGIVVSLFTLIMEILIFNLHRCHVERVERYTKQFQN